jgi:outer membrane protein TolC
MFRLSLFFLLSFLYFSNSVFSQNQNLDYYIASGLKNSPLLKDYANQVLSNSYDSLKIRGGLKPQVSAGAMALYVPGGTNWGYDSSITNGGNYSALISVNQPLFRNNFRTNQFESIALQNQSLAANAKITETDLKKGITAQYITAYADYSQMEFNRLLLQLLKDEQNLLKPLVEKGIYLQTDYLALSITIRTGEITIKQSMLQYKNDLYSLNLLCGISDTSVVGLSKPDIQLQNNADVSNSPLMMQFKIDSLKNINNKSLVDINYKPKLNAFADAGFMSTAPKNISTNFGTSIGLNFSIPIYDGRLRSLEYSKISLAENTRSNYRDFYLNQFQLRLLQLREELKSTDELIAEISNQLTEQQKLIDLYKAEIEKGLVRFSDFMLTVNNFANTGNTLKQAEINRQQIVNELNYIK